MVGALSSVNTGYHQSLIKQVKFSSCSLGGGTIWNVLFFFFPEMLKFYGEKFDGTVKDMMKTASVDYILRQA